MEKIKQALADLQAAEAANPGLDLTYDKGLLALAAKSVAVAGFDGVPYVYSDGTTLTQQQSQNATFAGVRYIHKWQ